ncbi:crotonase/enoyl-CoA hydratase family protein [Sorangium sp. So ce1182]|uniref:crotonase/enoyl-CoA hydratase family protein n=1 Tax=Sorangium sp. So ce1182 TaxID=3133334 RepID=UPI003F611A22
MSDPASAADTHITREVRGSLLLIGINRTKKKNAFDRQMLLDLSGAFTELERNPALRCGVVFSHGADFTAGLDLLSVGQDLARGEHIIAEDAVDPWGTHSQVRLKPVVVAVRGLCLTLGVELMLACDIRVASADTRFAQIEVKRGILPFGGATARFVAEAGWGNAMRWLLTGDEFDAREALRIGLVQEVVEPDQVLPRAIELAERVAAQAPLAIAATMRSARTAVLEGERAAMNGLLPELKQLMATEDAQEGLASFVERRAGNFKGR